MYRILLPALLLVGCNSHTPGNTTSVPIPTMHCERESIHPTQGARKLYSKDNQAELEKFAINEVEPVFPGRKETFTRTRVPHVALETKFGWLVGVDNGEFGGLLALVRPNSKPEVLLRINVEDIYEMPYGIVTTSGLDHMGFRGGDLYLTDFDTEDSTKSQILYSLPARPRTSWRLADGRLLVNMYDSSVVLNADGSLQKVRCSDIEYEDTDPSPWYRD